jgi:hypothetical protein
MSQAQLSLISIYSAVLVRGYILYIEPEQCPMMFVCSDRPKRNYRRNVKNCAIELTTTAIGYNAIASPSKHNPSQTFLDVTHRSGERTEETDLLPDFLN